MGNYSFASDMPGGYGETIYVVAIDEDGKWVSTKFRSNYKYNRDDVFPFYK
jgi:hypothetical protein